MAYTARTAFRRTRPAVLVARVLVATALVAVVMACQASDSPAPLSAASAPLAPPAADRAPRLLGESGNVPAAVTVFDDLVPAVAKLDPELLDALQRAGAAAKKDGVTFYVNSGWRSEEYQARMLRDAVREYGSEGEARRWVATAATSPHVSGDAVDLGPSKATTWLAEHGAAYGLCRIYDNEPWHYELRPDAVDHGCPPRYADPTHDPRMQ